MGDTTEQCHKMQDMRQKHINSYRPWSALNCLCAAPLILIGVKCAEWSDNYCPSALPTVLKVQPALLGATLPLDSGVQHSPSALTSCRVFKIPISSLTRSCCNMKATTVIAQSWCACTFFSRAILWQSFETENGAKKQTGASWKMSLKFQTIQA